MKKIVFSDKDFNLKDTFDCGQCFRWEEIDGAYVGVAVHRKQGTSRRGCGAECTGQLYSGQRRQPVVDLQTVLWRRFACLQAGGGKRYQQPKSYLSWTGADAAGCSNTGGDPGGRRWGRSRAGNDGGSSHPCPYSAGVDTQCGNDNGVAYAGICKDPNDGSGRQDSEHH